MIKNYIFDSYKTFFASAILIARPKKASNAA